MSEGDRLELIDQLTGNTVSLAIESTTTVRSIIDQQVERADHPRADFRGHPLAYQLLDEHGAALPPDQLLTANASVTLASAEGVDIRQRRDRWLAEIDEVGTASTSISTTTHLALVERTRSRLAETERLRARLITRHRSAVGPVGEPSAWYRRRGPVVAVIVGAGLVVALAGLGAFMSLGGDSDAAATAGTAMADLEPGEAVALPVELEMTLGPGGRDATTFNGIEGQNITIDMRTAPARGPGRFIDPQLELLDANGNRIGYNDDHLPTEDQDPGLDLNPLNARIDITLPADGDYVVVSSDLSESGIGSYVLSIEVGGPGGDGFNGAVVPIGPGFGPGPVMATTMPARR